MSGAAVDEHKKPAEEEEKNPAWEDEEDKNPARKEVKKFNKYWKESCIANCIRVILDPRYKYGFVEFRIMQAFGSRAREHLEKVDTIIRSLFQEYSHEMKGSLPDRSEEEAGVDVVTDADNPMADWEAHLSIQKKQTTSELDRYLKEELYPQKKDFDILGWWKMHAPKYPVMACIARDVLAIQRSTVASESAFSTGGIVISDHRTRLKSDIVEALICLQDWLKSAAFSPSDPIPTTKIDDEDCLVFYQASKCNEETTTTGFSQPKIFLDVNAEATGVGDDDEALL